MRSPGAGECNFGGADEAGNADPVLWTPHALPSVITLTALPAHLADPRFQLAPFSFGAALGADGAERIIMRRDTAFRVHLDGTGTEPPAVLLPLDRLFEIRVMAAIRLWRGLIGRNPGPDRAALPQARRSRLILALRAVDARLERASYREIARVLFGVGSLSKREWETHDLRDRTIRLARLGFGMIDGGYRRLLLHPYRRRS
jgi:hypothetical protein